MPISLSTPTCLAGCLLALLACTTRPAVEKQQQATEPAEEAAQPEAHTPRLEEGFSREAQEIGEPTDGLTLRAIRTESRDGFHRFVFDLDGDVLPRSRARLLDDSSGIEIAIGGVRMDETGNRPLVNEAGEPFGSPVPVEAPPIVSYGRKLVLDDSLVAYEIKLSRPASFRLGSDASSVVLDVATVE